MDHVDRVEPVGKKINQEKKMIPPFLVTLKRIIRSGAFSPPDGVILIDPEYLKERKGLGPSSEARRLSQMLFCGRGRALLVLQSL